MTSPKYPPKGVQAKRKADGLIGKVYVSSPKADLVAVRWSAEHGSGTFLFTAEQFASDWELTGTCAPRWKGRAAAIALLVILGICLYGGLRACKSTPASPRFSIAQQLDSVTVLEDPKALHEKYRVMVASECSMGADGYIRSVARYEFKREDVGSADEKFNPYVAAYVAQGVTASTSDKLLLQDGSGAFKSVAMFCTYDTGAEKILRYWIAESTNRP
ncbi:MAG TPA: hypothetical protein VGT08_01835 [Terracidiphilus sp.]|nr:hypothetical protein [Terracidiphilus sp.]